MDGLECSGMGRTWTNKWNKVALEGQQCYGKRERTDTAGWDVDKQGRAGTGGHEDETGVGIDKLPGSGDGQELA